MKLNVMLDSKMSMSSNKDNERKCWREHQCSIVLNETFKNSVVILQLQFKLIQEVRTLKGR
jgi:hypothetical protein